MPEQIESVIFRKSVFIRWIQRFFKKKLLSFFCVWCIISEGSWQLPREASAEQTVNYDIMIDKTDCEGTINIYCGG